MKNISIWLDGIKRKAFKSLDKDIDVDVLIIGGGITGISAAYHLSTGDVNVCLVEKNKLMEGVTSRTTGKLTYLQENIYSKLVNFHGREKAKLYLDSGCTEVYETESYGSLFIKAKKPVNENLELYLLVESDN